MAPRSPSVRFVAGAYWSPARRTRWCTFRHWLQWQRKVGTGEASPPELGSCPQFRLLIKSSIVGFLMASAGACSSACRLTTWLIVLVLIFRRTEDARHGLGCVGDPSRSPRLLCSRGTESLQTPRWRETDSNPGPSPKGPALGRVSKKSVEHQLDAKDEAWPTGRQRNQARPFYESAEPDIPAAPCLGWPARRAPAKLSPFSMTGPTACRQGIDGRSSGGRVRACRDRG